MVSDAAKYTMIASIGSAVIAGAVALVVHFYPAPTTLPNKQAHPSTAQAVTVTTKRHQKDYPQNVILVELPGIDTASAPKYTVAAEPYLHKKYGITIKDKQPKKSQVVFQNNMGIYDGRAIVPNTSQNFLTQINTGNIPSSFTLVFDKPLRKIAFNRPELYPHEQGITHPAWSAHALDKYGNELSSQGERIIQSNKNVPAQNYVLTAPGFEDIKALRLDSDPRLNGVPFAAFSAIVIDRLTLYPRNSLSN